jgi:hypothetical protein
MAVDQRRRQKKLEKRNAKQKAAKKAIARQRSGGLPSLLQHAGHAPIVDCKVASELFDSGIGYVILSRRLKGGDIAYVNILLDVWCLGAKDVTVYVSASPDYYTYLDWIEERFEMEDIAPECARKLVEGAIEFAAKYGLAPHPDYRVAKLIFGDIDASQCDHIYEYGKDGKPLYIAGPNDSLARSRQIANTIKAIDPDSHYMVTVHESRLGEARLPEWDDAVVIDEAEG